MNILLFPGSFSPFTDGHYGLISRYILAAKKQGYPIDKVKIFISSKDRENLNSKAIYKFVSILYSNDKRFDVVYSSERGPVADVYTFVNKESQKETNNYIFVRSNKDGDSVADDFYKNFGEGGKYALDTIKAIKLDVNNAPIVYKTRKDEYNGKPISGSVVRSDLRNKDYSSFLTSFQIMMRCEMTINKYTMKNLFDALVKQIGNETKETKKKLLKENLETNSPLIHFQSE